MGEGWKRVGNWVESWCTVHSQAWSVSGTRCVCTFFRREKTLLNDFEKREVFNLMSLLPLASKWVDRLYVLTLPLAL